MEPAYNTAVIGGSRKRFSHEQCAISSDRWHVIKPSLTAGVLAACLALVGWVSPRKEKVRIAVGSKPGNLVYLQIDLARALGYFAAEGLETQFEYYVGGTEAAAALSSRLADFSGNSIDHAIRERALGNDPRMVASFTCLPTVTLVIRHDLRARVRSVHDLAGVRVGVTTIGAGTHALLAAILEKSGLSISDIRVLPVGSGPQLVNAMKENEIDAAMATDPTTTTLLMAGEASILVDLVTFEETQRFFRGGYQFTGLMTRPDILTSGPSLSNY